MHNWPSLCYVCSRIRRRMSFMRLPYALRNTVARGRDCITTRIAYTPHAPWTSRAHLLCSVTRRRRPRDVASMQVAKYVIKLSYMLKYARALSARICSRSFACDRVLVSSMTVFISYVLCVNTLLDYENGIDSLQDSRTARTVWRVSPIAKLHRVAVCHSFPWRQTRTNNSK